MSYTLASITPQIAARLNDNAQTVYTNPILLPFAKDACDELQLEMELNGILALETISSFITVPLNTLNLGSLLPTDLLEPQRLEERLSGSSDLFYHMIRRQWEPDVQQTDSLRYWSYRGQDIYFVGATTDRQIKIYYLKRMFDIATINDSIPLNNSKPFLINRIAALAARFVGENKTRSDELNAVAGMCLNKLTRIGVKNKQGTRTRRKPFRVGRGYRWM